MKKYLLVCCILLGGWTATAQPFFLSTPTDLAQLRLEAYPNPFIETLRLEIEPNGQTLDRFVLLDILGQTVFSLDLTQDRGPMRYELDLSQLRRGVYIARVTSAREVLLTRKLVKSR